jgi:glycosyltransferase involved in cell wall biosynthesis
MQILFLAPFLPYPPDADGARLIIWNVAQELSKRHELTLLALSYGTEPRESIDAVRQCFREVVRIPVGNGVARKGGAFVRSFISGRPYGVEKFSFQEVQGEVQRLVDSGTFDAVHVDSYMMAQYRGRQKNTRWVLSAHDSRSLTLQDRIAASHNVRGPFAWLGSRELRLMRQYEAIEYTKYSSCIVVSEKDRMHLKELNPSLNVRVIQNGVRANGDAWEPPAELHGIAFVGDMGYFPNEEAVLTFTHQVFPSIQESVPDASFYVVGRNPSAEVRALQNLYKGLYVTGEVTDVREYLRRCGVSVAPLRYGSGVKNKILDAWAVGRPVVAFDEACTGLNAGFEEIIVRSSSPAEMAGEVIRILKDADLGRKLGMLAKPFVREHHSWEQAARQYEEVYQGEYQ